MEHSVFELAFVLALETLTSESEHSEPVECTVVERALVDPVRVLVLAVDEPAVVSNHACERGAVFEEIPTLYDLIVRKIALKQVAVRV